MHLFFDGLLPRPMCISTPNQEKLRNIRAEPQMSFYLDSKVKSPSSTDRIQNSSKTRPLVNVLISYPA